jgi:hypothetical protein
LFSYRRQRGVIAAQTVRPYVRVAMRGSHRIPMAPIAYTTASRTRPMLLVAGLGGAVMAATLGLWAYYGTAVFFEIVRAGWAACF